MKKKNIFAFLLSLVALGLEITPWGAVLRFGQPDGEPIRKTYSYFSLVPYGYANFFPLLTAILTCLLVGCFILFFIRKKEKNENSCFYLSLVGTAFSLMPLIYGFENFSLVGAMISLSLLGCALLTWKRECLK